MSVYFEINWSAVVPQGLHSTDTTSGFLVPTFPFSVQLWVRVIESTNRPTTGVQTIWWYGDKDSSNYIALQFVNSTDKLQLVAGGGYASIGTLTSASAITLDEWHLVTIVVSHSGEESPELKHVMYIDGLGGVTTTAAVSTEAWPDGLVVECHDLSGVTLPRRSESRADSDLEFSLTRRGA